MTIQLANDVIVAIKPEVTFNTAPGTGSGERLRILGSPGLSLVKQLIESGEVRTDALDTLARHGSQSVPATYNMEVSVDSLDTIFEANLRGTWVAATAITVTGGAALTSFTVDSTSQFTFIGTTTLLASGLREGDVFRWTNMSAGGNNNTNIRVKTIDAAGLVVTVHGTPLTVQGADSAATLTILRKVTNPSFPTRRSFYVQEYDRTIDVAAVAGGMRFTGFTLSGTPDGMVASTVTLLGASLTPLASGSSPYFITPSETTTPPLVAVDAVVSFNGTDVATCTAWNLEYTIDAGTIPVVGSTTTPDVTDTKARLSGSLTFAREDLAKLTLYKDETGLQLHLLLTAPGSEPKECYSIFIGSLVLSGLTTQIADSGARFEDITFRAGVPTGVAATTGLDNSLMTICTSAS